MRKTSKYYIKDFKIPIYGGTVVYGEYTSKNFYDIIEVLSTKYDLNPEVTNDIHLCHGLTYESYSEKKGKHYFLLVRTDAKGYLDTFSHEMSHIVEAIITHCGVKRYPGKANEAIAYLTGYLTELLINKRRIYK